MPEPKSNKQQFAQFGRNLSLLFNRAAIYQADHPYTKQSIDAAYKAINPLLDSISPLVFIMDRGQFFIDEEPLDPRINVSRVVANFRKAGIQSISFHRGLGKNELRAFVEIFSSMNKYPNAEAMKKGLTGKGVSRLKINHVLFKKVTAEDEVISRDALKDVLPQMMDDEAQRKSKKLFIDALLESVLTEEFVSTINIKNLIKNPAGLSKDMIEADLTSSRGSGAEDRRPGSILVQQLELIDQKVEKNLSGEEAEEVNLSDLASAVFDMKKQLMDGIEAQKALGIAYSHEELILDKANEITDKVLIQLVKHEYKGGEISTARLAQILRRLVPEADELKRLLPKIKAALLEEGMPLSEYVHLIQELGRELQSEGLAKILKESSEEIGIDGDGLIQELKRNPAQAAELIYLAAAIQKETGDEKALTDLLVDYIEKLGSKMTLDIAREDDLEGKQQLREVMTGVESQIVRHLKKMDMQDDVLNRLEERLNQRMDEILDNIRADWIRSQSGEPEEAGGRNLSVLQIMEVSVSDNEELGEILKIVRSKVESNEIDENDFKQIYTEISKQKEERRQQEAQKKMPPSVLKSGGLMFFIQKEISRAKRYDTPFASLAFSIVEAKPKARVPSGTITQEALTDVILQKLSNTLRNADIIGQLGKNKMAVLLPMTAEKEAKSALRRSMKLLSSEPIEVNGIPLDCKIAGVATIFDAVQTPNAKAFAKALSTKLIDMTARVKNIHAYF
jgi:molybdenum-dependent DNA-binding transcriptional regulator ModE/GGDEF domain-containing protein